MQTAVQNKSEGAGSGKIWNAAFISIFIANAMMNLGQQMVNTLIAKYADYLGAAATAVGLLASLFPATALFFKLFSGPTIGLTIYRYIGYNNTLFLAACCVVLGVVATGLAKIEEKEHKKFKITLSGVAAIEAIIPAILLFLFVGTYFTVSSFIAIYGTNMGVVK